MSEPKIDFNEWHGAAMANDGGINASNTLDDSAECVGSLLGETQPSEPLVTEEILKQQPLLTSMHALIAMLDQSAADERVLKIEDLILKERIAHALEQIAANQAAKSTNQPTDGLVSGVEYHEDVFYKKWQIAWEKAHPNHTQAERHQGIEVVAWTLSNFKHAEVS